MLVVSSSFLTSQEVTPAPGQPISRSPGCLPGNSPDANDGATHSSRTDALHLAACLTLLRSSYVTAMGKVMAFPNREATCQGQKARVIL